MATYLLLGLRVSDRVALQLLEGVQNMRESTTYQAILQEGREVGLIEGREVGRLGEAQRLLLLQGEVRFGTPDAAIRGAIEAIHDLDRLERIGRRVVDPNVQNWEDLLSTP